jgi:hypothetical protein
MPVEVVWRPGDPSAHYRPCGPPPKPALQPLRATAPRVLGEAGVGAQNRGARMYAVDNGWLEVTPTERDMQPHDMRRLTAAGFAQI